MVEDGVVDEYDLVCPHDSGSNRKEVLRLRELCNMLHCFAVTLRVSKAILLDIMLIHGKENVTMCDNNKYMNRNPCSS